MTKYSTSDVLNDLTLGKATEYQSQYNPTLLQGIPRSLNRDQLNITAQDLPFVGEDIWYGYEVSWLNVKGKPIVAVAEFKIPFNSDAIVESKSFKLYLNSFNQSVFSSFSDVENIMTKDLTTIVKAPVEVTLYPVDNCPNLALTALPATCIDELDITIEHYDLDNSLLENLQPAHHVENQTESLVSHLLKSNCLITNQPDWASIYMSYRGKKLCHETLLKYLISFRQHNEFHEQCVERIFCDLMQYAELEELTVFARYTRRGGLDINPFRSTHITSAPFARTIRQ